jgi:AbiTii-like protein
VSKSEARTPGWSRTLLPVTKRSDRLLQEIEAGALDSQTSIADVLRKLIALGGRSGSPELRDWAHRELKGYGPDDELPSYRQIVAPLQMDAGLPGGISRNQAVSSWQLPEVAQDKITNDLPLAMGIAEIERLARRCEPGDVVKLGPPLSQELVVLMNASGEWRGHIDRIYWAVSPTALEGVVDQVRTALTVLVAEIQANVPDGTVTPPAEVASNAINFAVTGKRNKIHVVAPQGGSTVTTAPEDEPRHRWKTVVTILGLAVAIVGAVFALMQAQGWSFG